MISDYNILNIYLILLNRNPSKDEILKYRNSTIKDIKSQIQESIEFKDLKTQNIVKLKEGLGKILKCGNPKFNYDKILKILVSYNYNFNIFYCEFQKIVNNIQNKYESYYSTHLHIKKQINSKDLVEIINNNYDIEFYIPTSQDYIDECRKKITDLTFRIN